MRPRLPTSTLFPYTTLFRSFHIPRPFYDIWSIAATLFFMLTGRPPRGYYRSGRLSMDEMEAYFRSEEHTSELQSRQYLVCRLLLEKKKMRIRRQPLVQVMEH